MAKELIDRKGGQIEEKIDGALVRMVSRYQAVVISLLGGFMVFVLSQMYVKIGLVFTDQARFNLYMHRNQDQVQLLKAEINELKQANQERLLDLRRLEERQHLHEKESARRWTYVLRDEETGLP